jgi:hypothetical protein
MLFRTAKEKAGKVSYLKSGSVGELSSDQNCSTERCGRVNGVVELEFAFYSLLTASLYREHSMLAGPFPSV